MTADAELARSLTDAVLATGGVTAVFPAKPIRHAAAEGIADVLDIPAPDIVVEVDVAGQTLTITAHIGASVGRPTPATLTDAAEALKAAAAAHGFADSMVFVKARLIAKPTDARSAVSL